MRERPNMITIGLAVLLIVSVLYIGIDKIQKVQASRQTEIDTATQQGFEQGYTQGITAAAVAVIRQTENCKPTIISVQNVTRQIIDLSCVKQQ